MGRKAANTLAYNNLQIDRAAKQVVGKQTEYKIEGVAGLSLVVMPAGTATFFCRYRQNGKSRRVRIGRHGLVDLAGARARALELMSAVDGGGDPIAEEKAQDDKPTFQQLWEQRRDSGELSPSTLNGYRYALHYKRGKHMSVMDQLGHLKFDEVTDLMLSEVLAGVQTWAAKYQVSKAQVAIGSMYNKHPSLAVRRADPARALGFIAATTARERVVKDSEIRDIWHGIARSNRTARMQLAIKLVMLTGQRVGQIVGAEVDELEIDGAAPKWVIPAQRMKMKRPQIVPLVPEAVELFRQALAISKGSRFVFPATLPGLKGRTTDVSRRMAVNSLSNAFKLLTVELGIEDARPHDMRRTICTWLAEREVSPAVLDAILAHSNSGSVTAVHYNMARLQGPIRVALDMWTAHVMKLVGDARKQAGKVVSLHSGASV